MERVTIYNKCGPVPGQNSLDAEIGGCAFLVNNLSQWIDKCMSERHVLSGLSPHKSFPEECLARAWTVTDTSASWYVGGLRLEASWCRVVKEECQEFSLSDDIETSVASRAGGVVWLGSGTLPSLPTAHWKKHFTVRCGT